MVLYYCRVEGTGAESVPNVTMPDGVVALQDEAALDTLRADHPDVTFTPMQLPSMVDACTAPTDTQWPRRFFLHTAAPQNTLAYLSSSADGACIKVYAPDTTLLATVRDADAWARVRAQPCVHGLVPAAIVRETIVAPYEQPKVVLTYADETLAQAAHDAWTSVDEPYEQLSELTFLNTPNVLELTGKWLVITHALYDAHEHDDAFVGEATGLMAIDFVQGAKQ